MKCAILAVGTELLFGHTVNTDAVYLSQQLNLMGMEAGDLRLPLCEPSLANRDRIRRALVQYGLLDA